ncbi:MAG: class I SAM-dependent methyltransferase [Peptococcaceae bacterium]
MEEVILKMGKNLLDNFFATLTQGGFSVRYWDGEEIAYGSSPPRVKIIFNEPLPLSFNLTDPMVTLGEAYMDEIIDFEGSMDEIMKLIDLNKDNFSVKTKGILGNAVKTANTLALKLTQKSNIHHHYDLGNDFFALWLDESMSYSCGYFKNPADTLYQAQMQKIDHTLKKLQLKPGEKLLDIGSGWGQLIIRAAQAYDVQAVGITLSEEQYQATLEQIKSKHLEDKVAVKLQDYLDLQEEIYQFDKIVSVGMFEHVGRENLPKYMEKVSNLLKPGGLSLLHSIMGTNEKGVNSWITKYIFPGGYIPSLRETIWLLPQYDFHLLHAESLRMHYAMTLDRWHKNYLKNWDTVQEKFGRKFARMWSLYLQGCAANFRVSGLNIYQLLFSKGLNNNLNLNMEYIYS